MARIKNSGRAKGSKNKIQNDLRLTVLASLDAVGGIDYLIDLAEKEPKAYASLIGRCLPKAIHVTGDVVAAFKIVDYTLAGNQIGKSDDEKEVSGVTVKQAIEAGAEADVDLSGIDRGNIPVAVESKRVNGADTVAEDS